MSASSSDAVSMYGFATSHILASLKQIIHNIIHCSYLRSVLRSYGLVTVPISRCATFFLFLSRSRPCSERVGRAHPEGLFEKAPPQQRAKSAYTTFVKEFDINFSLAKPVHIGFRRNVPVPGIDREGPINTRRVAACRNGTVTLYILEH